MNSFVAIINSLIILCLLVIFYTYIGYPIILLFLSRFFSKTEKLKLDKSKEHIKPAVKIILVMHNEKKCIIDKLDNLLKLNYPIEKLGIIIVDDGSTDGSDKLVRKYIDKAKANISIITQPHKGKAEGINNAVRYIKTQQEPQKEDQLIMFCDARQKIKHNALSNLVRWFQDANTGYVSGITLTEATKGSGIYWKYETFIREKESSYRSVSGGTGQLSLCWLSLIPVLPEDLILDDVFIPMNSILKGKFALLDKKAIAYDKEFDIKAELYRKYRTLCGNFQLLKYLPTWFNFKKNFILFEYLTHKLFRLIVPLLIVLIFICSMFSFLFDSLFGAIMLSLQLLFYFFALIGKFLNKKPFNLSYTILSLNLAVIIGFIRFIKKDCRWTKNHH